MTRCRIGLLVTLAFSLFVALCAAEAQPPGKVARVGYLATAVPDCSASVMAILTVPCVPRCSRKSLRMAASSPTRRMLRLRRAVTP